MATTVTTTESWGSRLGSSLRGIVVGLALFVAGFPVLFWNEGNSVKTAKAIDEGEGACVSLDTNETVDPDMNGRLVHVTGKADTTDVLTDDDFGVSVTAINLKRKVEMYQWVEDSRTTEKKNLGGSVTTTTTYTYKKAWVEGAIDSGSFHEAGHDNPGALEFEETEAYAQNVSFGAFRLNKNQIESIGGSQAYRFPAGWTSRVDRVQIQGQTLFVPNAETRNNKLNNRDVASQPRIGDMRVTFSVVLPHDVSIIAKQHGDTFVPYTAKNGKKLSYVHSGVADADEMFATARSNNAFITWLIRLAGFLLMFFGLSAVLKPLSVLADVLPILGDIVGIGTGIVAGLVAIVCALVTIAVAWLFYRPVLGIALLAAAGFFVWKLIQKKKAAKTAQGTPAQAS